MPRRLVGLAGLTLAGSLIVTATDSTAAAQDAAPPSESPTALKFVEGLRERGYYDLAIEEIGRLRQAPDTPAGLRAVLDFEEARGLVDEAGTLADLARRSALLEQARARLDAFLKAGPDHPRAPAARVQLAGLFYQRGRTAALQATEADEGPDRQARLVEARAAFAQARDAYQKAEPALQAAFDAFDKFIPEGDPRRDQKERAQIALMEALLQRSVVGYEEAQTFPAGSKERNDLLDQSIEQFKGLYESYRTWMAGFSARMWQGKCYEEKGDLRAAMGIYNELLGHDDPALFGLQRQVAYFKIIVLGKRAEFALAADQAARWLTTSKNDRGSYERLGVEFELAKDLHAQLEDPANKGTAAEREAAQRRIAELLSDVVRYASPFKTEAAALLKRYKARASVSARELAALSYDQAKGQAQEAIAAEDWQGAAALLRAALRRVDPARESDKACEARYLLAYSYYMADRYPEAAVAAEHLARRYPKWESSLQSAELGLSALARSYEDSRSASPEVDLARLVGLADFIAAGWPDTDQADTARLMLGELALKQGRPAAAVAAFEAVREGSTRRLDALAKAGAAHWRLGLALRQQAGDAPSPEADAEAKLARDRIEAAYHGRVEAKAPPTDAGLLETAGDLAELNLAESRPADAVALLDPYVKALGAAAPLSESQIPIYARLLKLILQAHIGAGQTDLAIADMKALEQANTGEALTQLFFGLGRLLEQDLEAQKARGDTATVERTRQTYQKFLEALAASQSGQTFESLQWAGEAMLTIDRPKEAAGVFDRVLKDFPAHPQIVRTKLKQAAALRRAGDFEAAWAKIDVLIKANPKMLDALMERCQLLEDWAVADKRRWATAIAYWRQLALLLGNARTKPPEYYECWYHVASCQARSGQKGDAKRTLKSVMALSSTLGKPATKQQYDDLIRTLGN